MEETYSLDFSNAQPLSEDLIKLLYWEASHNGIEIYPLDDETPCAWDAGVDIQGDDLVISGGFGPSGYGSVVIKFPKKDASRYYSFDVWIKNDSGQWDQARRMLEEAGVVVTKKE